MTSIKLKKLAYNSGFVSGAETEVIQHFYFSQSFFRSDSSILLNRPQLFKNHYFLLLHSFICACS